MNYLMKFLYLSIGFLSAFVLCTKQYSVKTDALVSHSKSLSQVSYIRGCAESFKLLNLKSNGVCKEMSKKQIKDFNDISDNMNKEILQKEMNNPKNFRFL